MTNEATMTAALETMFADLNAAYIERSIAWAKERKAAMVAATKGEDETYQELKAAAARNPKNREERFAASARANEYYRSLAGGKGWFNMFSGRNWEMIEPLVRKNCDRVIEKRNLSIVAKMVKAEVTEITGTDISHTSDGFHGRFEVKTNKGDKTVNIETILAGGYNIQCLHNRTLVKIR